MKRATLIVLFIATLFVLLVALLFRGCAAPARHVAGIQYRAQINAPITPVPEPATYGVFAACFLAGLAIYKRSR